jgi:hypothetical protein
MIATALIGVAGCGRSTGLERYPISGRVTFHGQPVPGGYIYFRPDTAKGGSGPASGAEIHDGSYATPSGKGTSGGPHIISINGHDGVSLGSNEGFTIPGRSLFSNYEVQLDIPRESSTRDFDVPSTPSLAPASGNPLGQKSVATK